MSETTESGAVLPELLPCPFCGDRAEEYDKGKGSRWVQCYGTSFGLCEAATPALDTLNEARVKWNTRKGEGTLYTVCDSLRAERDAAIAERDTAVRLLRELQWEGGETSGYGCPYCGRYAVAGHSDDCNLAAIINTTPAQRGGEAT